MFYATASIISLIYITCCNAMALSICKDESIFCNVTTMNICARPDLSQYCHKTCNLCDHETSTVIPAEECSDQWTNCTRLEPTECLSNPNIATIYCAKTCNNCTATTTTIITTTPKPNHDKISWIILSFQ
ncbi:Peptidyl serine alpha-galactosyltransferase [Dirofilaria immitis]